MWVKSSRDEVVRSTRYRLVELPLALSDAPIVNGLKMLIHLLVRITRFSYFKRDALPDSD